MVHTDFNSCSRYDYDGGRTFPPSPKNTEMVRSFPNSSKMEGDCPNDSCDFRGTYVVCYGHNNYYECPECEEVMMKAG